MGALSYGFDKTLNDDTPPRVAQSGAASGGGISGSQVGSQTAGQGAGITPMGSTTPASQTMGFGPTYNFNDAMTGGQGFAAGEPSPNAPGGLRLPYTTQTQPGSRTTGGGDTTTAPGSQTTDYSTMLNQVQSASTPQDAAVAQDQLARSLSTTLSGAGHDVKWKDQNTLMVDGRPYTVGGASMNNTVTPPTGGASTTNAAGPYSATAWTTNAGQPSLPDDLANWRPGTSPYYTPGEIDFSDIPNFTREQLLQELQGGEVNDATKSLMMSLLNNPTALSDQVVDTMKAQQRNTLAEQQRQEEEDMRGFGAQSGIADSRWLANQMLGSRQSRDQAVAKAAQDIDVQAAQTRMGDKRAAAQLGMQYGAQRAQNIGQATSQALARSAAIGDRQHLRESVKQAAAQLRISQDQVMSNFVLEKERNLLQKYGIDLGAQIDASKLNEQSAEFKEDLMFKMQQLEQQMAMAGRQLGQAGDQFNRELQYRYDVFNQQNADTAWSRDWLSSHDLGS